MTKSQSVQTDWLFIFPLQRVISMIFKGGGDCTAIDWTFLGGSIVNWSFVCFTLIGLLAVR
jgi:disulfide bond formation protein DsbB